MFDVPPLFQLIREQAAYDPAEMYRVFNMGHRLELYVPEEIANELIIMSAEFGIEAKRIGYCTKSETPSLTIQSAWGTFKYSRF
jgi:phosphoribosylformylglycinamidine cyclo-ligase